ncbi:hypothetical protein nbrc107696_18580 [Gordonia spumicola]|uniref:Uncharacterized protein n=1 Tax=Gordonia spumicola TaxID=589161 RepID=A0A7I9V874_9ACTN|nr:hypothetical protein [Gordonia spumicola]GEE01412.1 hypothetical protein nbrc107696_18580 [Gordonia spumicola]
MSTRIRVGAVIGAIGAVASVASGVGTAQAWTTATGHPASGMVDGTTPTVSLTNTTGDEFNCVVYLYGYDKLPKLQQMKPLTEKLLELPPASAEAKDAEVKAAALAAEIGDPTAFGGRAVPIGQTVDVAWWSGPTVKAPAYTVQSVCTIEGLGTGSIGDYDVQVFGIGTPPDTGSSDVFGSVEGVLPDFGELFG